jgi:hypothetical protein
MGLRPGVKAITGALDSVTELLGNGIIRPRRAMVRLETAGAVMVLNLLRQKTRILSLTSILISLLQLYLPGATALCSVHTCLGKELRILCDVLGLPAAKTKIDDSAFGVAMLAPQRWTYLLISKMLWKRARRSRWLTY